MSYQQAYRTVVRPCLRQHFIVAFIVIISILFVVFGIEDKKADYFKKGKFITNTEGWQYRYNGVIYPYGLMVSHPSLIAILTIVFMLIFWIAYECVKVGFFN